MLLQFFCTDNNPFCVCVHVCLSMCVHVYMCVYVCECFLKCVFEFVYVCNMCIMCVCVRGLYYTLAIVERCILLINF